MGTVRVKSLSEITSDAEIGSHGLFAETERAMGEASCPTTEEPRLAASGDLAGWGHSLAPYPALARSFNASVGVVWVGRWRSPMRRI